MDVSVIVPTRRRPGLLARCLESLARQRRADFEVIVVCDGPDEETLRIARGFAPRMRIRAFALDRRRGPAAARNAGARAAVAPLLAFTDDDTIADPDWLHAALDSLPGAAVAAAGTTVVPLPDDPTDHELDVAGLERSTFPTANAFCRAVAFHAVGGFDERFTRAWREDSDLEFSLIERFGAASVARIPAAIVVHPVRPASPWISLLTQSKARFNALLHAKHPALYRERIACRPPLRSYAAVLCFAAAVLSRSPAARLMAAGTFGYAIGDFLAERALRTTRRPIHRLALVITTPAIPFLSVAFRLVGAVRTRSFFL